jgi:Protein of unknown function (DUF998)
MNFKHTIEIDHVNRAIAENYRNLRTRIGVLAFAFPIILVVIGWFKWAIEVKPALSDYYFALNPVASMLDQTPMRLWFCGILFVVGFFLHRYRGFSRNEDRWLSVAGGFTLGVAIFPESMNGHNDYDFVLAWTGLTKYVSLHAICAVLAFVCIAIVIVWYADSTLSELDADPSARDWYKRVYRGIAIFMIVSIGVSISLKYWLGDPQGKPDIWTFAGFWQQFSVILAETFGIWAFAAYWFVKNSELDLVAAEVKKTHGKMAPLKLPKPDIIDKL